MSSKALLLDLDGTLLDNLEPMFQVYSQFCESHDFEGSREHFNKYSGRPLNEFLSEVLPDMDTEEISRMNTQYMNLVSKLESNWPLREYSLELMNWAKSNAFLLGLVTSSPLARTNKFLKDCDIADVFDVVITAEDVQFGKPHKEPFSKAINKLKVSPSLSFAVEDSHSGVKSAHGAGAKSILLSEGDLPTALEGLVWKKAQGFKQVEELLSHA